MVAGVYEWQELIDLFICFFGVLFPGHLSVAYVHPITWRKRDEAGRIQSNYKVCESKAMPVAVKMVLLFGISF